MKPLRLLAIIEAYSMTGPAKNLIEFATIARDFDVDTGIATFVRGEESNAFIEIARKSGITVHILHERGLGDKGVIRDLAKLVASERPDIIQTHAVKSHFLARLAELPKYAPWIAFHHGYTWPTMRARAYNQLDRWSLRAAARVLTVNLPFREELAAKGVARERIEIVHNAIRSDWGAMAAGSSEDLRTALGIAPGRNVILSVGRLSREKNHLSLLRAFHQLPSNLNSQLLVVGEGPERGRIERQIQRLGLAGQVTLTGHQRSAESYYRIANLAVLSSRTEGSPNALLEAMAAGVPVVATNVGGIPEIVTHDESALLVPPGDIGKMASAMEKLLTDASSAQKFVARGRVLVMERHAPAARAKRLAEVYRSVAGVSE
ncbi:MAG TPA: glycosyltransferase family 4 protein [Bryobacteraceae bacterium]|nr:glycosyltransferase family 4 protein [Bryobacteraceae bacterium]